MAPNDAPTPGRPSQRALLWLARRGWRCWAFAAFCAALASIGFLYAAADRPGAETSEQRWCALTAGLLTVVALAAPLLIPRGKLPRIPPRGERPRLGLPFWSGAGIALLGAGWLWEARLDASLWTDEVTSLRSNIVGRWKHDGEGSGRLKVPSWHDTLIEYDTPNNHMLYSAVARVVHERFGGINDTDFSRPYFSERLLRLPCYLAALLSLPLVGYLALRLAGHVAAAWLAMGWAALHPWYLEFATSARGYAFAMAFLALAFAAAVRIFKDGGGWRTWILFGLGQLLAFSSVPTLLHALVALNVAVALGLLFDRGVPAAHRAPHLRAFLAANLVAAGGAAAGFGSKIEPFQAYVDSGHYDMDLPWSWLGDCFSNLLTGQPYRTWEEGHPWAFATSGWPAPLLAAAALLAAACLAAALARGARRGPFQVSFAIACALPPITAFVQGKAMGFYLFPWYAVWQLPMWIALFSAGAVTLARRPGAARFKAAPHAAAGLALALVTLATWNPRNAYLSVPVEPQRESAAVFRPSPNPYAPGHGEILSASIVTANHAYDPWNHRLREVGDLWPLIARAEQTGKPLYVDTAWLERVRSHHPDFVPVLLDRRHFDPVAKLHGLQPQNTRYVFRYRPGSLRDEALKH